MPKVERDCLHIGSMIALFLSHKGLVWAIQSIFLITQVERHFGCL